MKSLIGKELLDHAEAEDSRQPRSRLEALVEEVQALLVLSIVPVRSVNGGAEHELEPLGLAHAPRP